MLECQGATYLLPSGRALLRDITARVVPHSLTAIMGLNGAGKTTLLKILSRFLRPTRGQVLYGDQSLTEYSVKALARQLAYVPQDFPTEFPFTVEEFVMMGRFAWQQGLFPSEADYGIVRQSLVQLELSPLRCRSITTLSGGEKQRVLMARALAQTTPVILLDEPLNHLDIKHRLFILNLLREECAREGKTVIAVMHDFQDVRDFFTHAWLLKDGELRFAGPVARGFQADLLSDVFDVDVLSRLRA